MLREKIEYAFNVLREALNYDNYYWEIGYSGGKDSSVLLHLIIDYLLNERKRPEKVFVVYSDTYLDLPELRRHTIRTLCEVREFSLKEGLPIEVRVLEPDPGEDFFSMMIEKGYPTPHFRFRWCMQRLKINPTMRFFAEHEFLAMVTGVRLSESYERRRVMKKRGQDKPIVRLGPGRISIAPILNWSTEDVWNFLLNSKQPWNGRPHRELYEIYRLGDTPSGCTSCQFIPNARFGCWVCTVVRKDRLLENASRKKSIYRHLIRAKEMLKEISKNPEYRIWVNNRPRKLNQKGRIAVIDVLAYVLKNCPEGLEGYLENQSLKEKMKKWLRFYKSTVKNT